MNLAIIYYSETGHTQTKGEQIAEGMKKQGAEVRMFNLKDGQPDKEYIESCAGIVFGTPTYYASTCWQLKKFFDADSSGIKLAGKLGGVYATANWAQGGADVANLTIVGHMLVKGMLAYSSGGEYGKPIVHLGPTALVNEADCFDNSKELFEIYGERFAKKAKELFD
ncbi:MAG: flavodoxin family protein [Firmicutes bacterium]|nr:flavodoxin family protein [Bacillota bacterium]